MKVRCLALGFPVVLRDLSSHFTLRENIGVGVGVGGVQLYDKTRVASQKQLSLKSYGPGWKQFSRFSTIAKERQ